MHKITFITALIRPANIPLLYQSIASSDLPWNWIIVVDGKAVSSLALVPPAPALVLYRQIPTLSYGFLEKNEALDIIEDDPWIYFLDDDTSLHPNFIPLFRDTLNQRPDARGMVFAQQLPDGSVRTTNPGEAHYTGKIDMCQFVVRRSAIAYHRFFATFGSDGEFFTRVYRENAPHFVFRPEIGFHHNNLRTGEKWDPERGYGRPY